MKNNRKKVKDHIHLHDIPKSYYPKNSKALNYRNDLIRLLKSLNYTNQNVQYNAQICTFNIKSIPLRRGFTPEQNEVFRKVEEFVYNYENYCYRVFSAREKLIQFLNAILPIGFEENEVKIRNILVQPVIKQAGLFDLIELFNNKKSPLAKIMADRNSLTHKLYYTKEVDSYLRPVSKKEEASKSPINFKLWCHSWIKEIKIRANLTNKAEIVLSSLVCDVSSRIVSYKLSLKKGNK